MSGVPNDNVSETSRVQLDVANKLFVKVSTGHGAILSSPVGSGKTRMAWMFIRHFTSGIVLILVPQCVIFQWVKEMEPIFQGLLYLHAIYHGQKKPRTKVLESFLSSDIPLKVLITTVETYYSDANVLASIPWSFVVFDEIHRFRNTWGKMYQSLLKLECCKLGLTGTLVTSNAHTDLVNLLHLVDPTSHTELVKSKTLSRERMTQEIVNKHVIAITRSQLNIRMIPKVKRWNYIDMTPLEMEVYKKALWKYDSAYYILMSTAKGHPNYVQALDVYKRSLGQLQKVDSYAFISEVKVAFISEKDPERAREILRNAPISGKHRHFLNWIKDKNPRDSILVFDDYKTGSRVLAEKLISMGRTDVAVYSGDLTREEKDEIIRKFLALEIKILFLVKKAGGIGLNLQIATYVVFLSTSFHPVEEHQCIGRADRITSTAKKIRVAYLDYVGGFGNIRHGMYPIKDQHADAVQRNTGIETLGDPQGYHNCICHSTFEKLNQHWERLKISQLQKGTLVGFHSEVLGKPVNGVVLKLLSNKMCEVEGEKSGTVSEWICMKELIPRTSDMMFMYIKDFFNGGKREVTKRKHVEL